MENSYLRVPFNDGKRFYVGQFLKISLLSPQTGETVEITGHIVRCEQEGTQTIIEIEHDDPSK